MPPDNMKDSQNNIPLEQVNEWLEKEPLRDLTFLRELEVSHELAQFLLQRLIETRACLYGQLVDSETNWPYS
jgi:hypothetical protein